MLAVLVVEIVGLFRRADVGGKSLYICGRVRAECLRDRAPLGTHVADATGLLE
jgi:hypothetical protein